MLTINPGLRTFLTYCASLIEGSDRGEYPRDSAAYGIIRCLLDEHINDALDHEPVYREIRACAMTLDFIPEA